jgi:excinuclease UvrABC nuclease subunit
VRSFDRKFGDDFLTGVPAEPGVYRFYGPEDALLYVGKARNLRRRLAQYRTTGRRKKGRKRRALIRLAGFSAMLVYLIQWMRGRISLSTTT